MKRFNTILMNEAGGEGGEGGNNTPPAPTGMMGGENTPPAGGTPPPEAWSYAEGVNGEGDRPDWFKGKYNSVEAQAKAYNDLESRFGGFTGSPEEFAPIEGFKEEGESAIMMATIKEIAKDSNMNQNTYEKIVKGIAQNIDGYRESMQQDQMQEAIKSIPNFEARRSALADTAQANLTTEQFDGLNGLMSTQAGFEAIEALTTQIRGGALPGGQAPAEQRSSGDIMAEMNSLSPTDMRGRSKLLQEMNAQGDGVGSLV